MKIPLKNISLKLTIIVIFFLCQTAVAATLDVGSQQGEKGDTVTFNINVSDLTEEMDSLGFDVQYDFTILKYDSYQRGSLTENFRQLSALNIALGEVRIGGFDTGENVIAGGAGGDIVRLTFEVVGQGDCNIKVTNLKDDLKSYAAQGGRFTYGPQTDDAAATEPDDDNTAADPTSETTGNAANLPAVKTDNTAPSKSDDSPENNDAAAANTGMVNDAPPSPDSNAGKAPESENTSDDVTEDDIDEPYPPARIDADTGRSRRYTPSIAAKANHKPAISENKKKAALTKRPESVKTKRHKPVRQQKIVSKLQILQSAEQIQALIDENARLIKQSHELIKENLKLIKQNNKLILKNSYALEYMEKTKPASDNVILIIIGILILLVLIFILIALLLLLLHFGFFSSQKSVRVRLERR
ncbi:cohesin domain-containing protein [Desulfococcaceae bacterium HSG7]|nr:cohesin domain-containing protein [Desulfococcaceae bacterium HSG7]